jgi:predicted phage baseplate assembly protein
MEFDFLPKLPKSNLDDRTFKDLVEECILRIPRYCPEWTNHNPGDPGITFIELFAWLTDQMLLRFNQVPRRNYVAFLELLGIRLNPPSPARCQLTFYLTQALPQALKIPADTEVATVRTETEEAIIFTTDRDFSIGNPQIDYLFISSSSESGAPQRLSNRTPSNGQLQNFSETLLFNDSPSPGNCFYLVLTDPDHSIAGNILALNFKGEPGTTTGINPEAPPLQWSAWNGREWVILSRIEDKTKGFSFSGVSQPLLEGGDVILHLPQTWCKANFGGDYEGYWIRCQYVETLNNQSGYDRSPRILGLSVRAIGGVVDGTECVAIQNELLGVSNGKAGQVFELQGKPVLERHSSEHIRIKLSGTKSNNWQDWEEWTEVRDFAASRPSDRHYVIDSQTGEVQFGPLIREPSQLRSAIEERSQLQSIGKFAWQENGRSDNLATYIPPETERTGSIPLERQYGQVPAPGGEIYMVRYRTGGGKRGNVKAGKLTVLKNSIPYVKSVINYSDGVGGTDAESIEQAAIRVPMLLRTRESAVTPEDFERVTMAGGNGSIARIHCITQQEYTTPGIVKLLVIPECETVGNSAEDRTRINWQRGMKPDVDFTLTRELEEKISKYVSDRKPLGIQVKFQEPEYVGVGVDIEVILEPSYKNIGSLQERIRNARDRIGVARSRINTGESQQLEEELGNAETELRRVQEELNRIKEGIRSQLLAELYSFLNPLTGGIEGKGWEWGRPLYTSDIFARCQKVLGVRYLGAVNLFRLDKVNAYGLRPSEVNSQNNSQNQNASHLEYEWERTDIEPEQEQEIKPGALGLICSWDDSQFNERSQLQSAHIIRFVD